MSRGIFLIGVSKTQGQVFDTLYGVEDAVDRIERWAHKQKFDYLIRMTDVAGDVTIDKVKKRMFALIRDDPTLEQVVVYFSGHGVVNGLCEYWLLSGAPEDSGEAINVTGSSALAMAGSVPHVVFISDACRTSAASVQTGRINGSNIFPNKPNPDTSQAVDVFYATRLGAPALEVAADRVNYVAVYTEVLAEALNGADPMLVRDGLIRPRPLKEWLKDKVPRALASKKLVKLVSQTPDAQIGSGDTEWIARFADPESLATAPARQVQVGKTVDKSPEGAAAPAGDPRPTSAPEPHAGGDHTVIRSSEAIEILVADALNNLDDRFPSLTSDVLVARTGRELTKTARALLEESIPDEGWYKNLNLARGFLVVGGGVSKATSHTGPVAVTKRGANWSIDVPHHFASEEVLVEFSHGGGVLLPVVRDYVCIVQMHDQEVKQIHYEPSNADFSDFPRHELQKLRTAFFAASRMGELNLEARQVADLGTRMQGAKFADPALAIYAAYAYQSIGKLEQIREMAWFLLARHNLRLFDVSLLAREFLKSDEKPDVSVVPSLPLLTQGWAFMEAFYPSLPLPLRRLQRYVGTSLWTQYSAEGVQLLDHWMLRTPRKKSRFIHFRGDA